MLGLGLGQGFADLNDGLLDGFLGLGVTATVESVAANITEQI